MNLCIIGIVMEFIKKEGGVCFDQDYEKTLLPVVPHADWRYLFYAVYIAHIDELFLLHDHLDADGLEIHGT